MYEEKKTFIQEEEEEVKSPEPSADNAIGCWPEGVGLAPANQVWGHVLAVFIRLQSMLPVNENNRY